MQEQPKTSETSEEMRQMADEIKALREKGERTLEEEKELARLEREFDAKFPDPSYGFDK